MGYYIENKETGKIELYFDKSEYLELSDDVKNKIKSNFLFSRRSGAWISRRKFPNLWLPKRIADELNLEDHGAEGETLSFEEQMKRKAERAEYRADRYEAKAERAMEEGRRLQKPIESHRGDIAFFTQPNINSSAGRAFTRQRERMFSAWEKGFESFKKSEYYESMAETARNTAAMTKTTNKSFCQRRVWEAEAGIRKQKRYMNEYKDILASLDENDENNAARIKTINESIARCEEIIESYISKCIYYRECIEKAGGINFTSKDIKPGDTIRVKMFGDIVSLEVCSRGSKYIYTKGGLRVTYSEIEAVIPCN